MVAQIGRQALETTVLVSAPMLGLSLLVGLLVSLFQAMTQINEATLTFVPKMLALFVATLLFFPWMLDVLVGFMAEMLANIPNYVRGS
jgi:flagellar biosynthetic protein FliQ